MRFMLYWFLCILWAVFAYMENILIGIGKGMFGQGHLVFWIEIGVSFFFLLAAYGSMIEDKGKSPPADDNPF